MSQHPPSSPQPAPGDPNSDAAAGYSGVVSEDAHDSGRNRRVCGVLGGAFTVGGDSGAAAVTAAAAAAAAARRDHAEHHHCLGHASPKWLSNTGTSTSLSAGARGFVKSGDNRSGSDTGIDGHGMFNGGYAIAGTGDAAENHNSTTRTTDRLNAGGADSVGHQQPPSPYHSHPTAFGGAARSDLTAGSVSAAAAATATRGPLHSTHPASSPAPITTESNNDDSPHVHPFTTDLRSDHRLDNLDRTASRQSTSSTQDYPLRGRRQQHPGDHCSRSDRRSPSYPRTAPSSPYSTSHRQPYYHHSATSSTTTAAELSSPQDKLERLAAEAQSVLSGAPFTPSRFESAVISDTASSSTTTTFTTFPHSPATAHHHQNLPSRPPSSASSTTASSSLGIFSPPRERSAYDHRERERLQHSPLTVVPESPGSRPSTNSTKTTPCPSPQMSSTNANTNKAIPRSSSIDSAISSASAISGAGSHSHSQSSSANNLLSNVTGTSSADIQSLIQAAGSAEELIRYMLKDKQSLTAQNAQLWRLVDKQRGMILGLNKDLERALREKDRYRTKLKEQLGKATSSASSPMVQVSSQGESCESPAPSEDARTGARPGSPTDVSGERTCLPTPEEQRQRKRSDTVTPASAIEERIRRESEASSGHETPRRGSLADSQEPSNRSPPDLRLTIGDMRRSGDDIDTATPMSEGMQSPGAESTTSSVYSPPQPPPKPMNQARKLGISTSVPPVTGLGKSPIRKAPPAPLALSQQRDAESRLHPQNQDDDEEVDGGIINTVVTACSTDSWQATPEDKVGFTALPTPGLLSTSPIRQAPLPVPEISQPVPPTPSLELPLSPRTKQQFAKPMASPGLPSSPRPMDRPMNSPRPRNSRLMDGFVGLPNSPKPPPLASPRMSMPANHVFGALPSPRPPFAQQTIHERTGSAGSVSSLPNLPSAAEDPKVFDLQPSAIHSIDARVVSSRMRPSRLSMMPGKAKENGDAYFTLGVFSRSDDKELVRVEKDANSLSSLDAKLRKCITVSAKLPDKSLFLGHAPARIDARRTAIDQYFSGVLGATLDEKAAQVLCDFFTSDVVDRPSNAEDEKHSPKSVDLATGYRAKEGFLTKKGKNFGGWKERYFVLDGPVLKYFDKPDGAHLGQIKLHNAQIGRQSSNKDKHEGGADEDSEYRHAFLVLEPKRKDTSSLIKHVLCAESDGERDEWVSALLENVNIKSEEESPGGKLKKTRHGSKKDSKDKDVKDTQMLSDEAKPVDQNLRALSYEETNAGPAPARGPTPEEVNRQHVSPSPSSMLSQTPSNQYNANAPIPDRGQVKQISGPTGGSVISDLAAWGAVKTDKPTEKALKKRSIWGFRQRSSSDLTTQAPQAGHQAAAERFPLPRHVFGATLEEAVYLTRPPGMELALPAVVYRCIEYLDAHNASEEEGIFRLSGSNVVIKGLKDRFNSESDVNLFANDEYYDVHAIASLLKLYLRELPTNILTPERREAFVQVTEMQEKSAKIRELNRLVHSLPIENFSLLKALSGHLLRIVDNADINKMTIRNIGIVFSPTLNIPAQVFSMFLHEYQKIFFREDEVAESPKPLAAPQRPKLPDPPGTPTATMQALMALQRRPEPNQPAGYEPQYERREPPGSPTMSNPPGSAGGLAPPSDKSTKNKRRESSMMFMMGGMKKGMFDKSSSKTASTTMVSEDSIYE